MKYVEWTKYGPPHVLRISNKEKVLPKDDELLIKIQATTVTAGDCEVRSLKFPLLFKLMIRLVIGLFKPNGKVLGQEFSGIIEAVGKNVSLFKVGDHVFGSTGFTMGTYSQYLCIKEKPKSGSIALKPVNMSFDEATTIPIGGMEAIHFLKKVDLQEGQKILVNGAGGSIGTLVIQLANYFGAIVTAVDSEEKLEFLASVGANKTIDYKKEDFTKNSETYDVIFDVVGKSNFLGSIESLRSKGTYLIANPSSKQKKLGKRMNRLGDKKVYFDSANQALEDLLYLKHMIEEGHLTTYIDKTFSLKDIVESHKYVESGHKKGNVVITMDHDKQNE